ncbi:GNAT family N-acetyltransferase [Companilactobacillus suantsaicola]|uniref:GNAT family N-acetyltransferase n=1 Tax=Companilactobacillus suantsaicola TaxID=2487723 RepID=A0A4Z0JHP3_9LACO|nr:GNAT family N-acetyltransferase [Companilactobacillus suantsaicola]TGD21844.1 GNAT family N-acetyltransferase [Companilactobacillus suantsaicola]
MSEIVIKELVKKDLDKVSEFASLGMGFDQYTENKLALKMYSRYVALSELAKSTLAIGAYMDNRLVGFIFARLDGQRKVQLNVGDKLLVKLLDSTIEKLDWTGLTKKYNAINQDMLSQLPEKSREITFFAVDPTITGRGIGTTLINTAEKYLHGPTYVLTDSNCNYQFYLHRGFKIFAQNDLKLEDDSPLTCYVLTKRL